MRNMYLTRAEERYRDSIIFFLLLEVITVLLILLLGILTLVRVNAIMEKQLEFEQKLEVSTVDPVEKSGLEVKLEAQIISDSERKLVESVIAAEARGEEGIASKMAIAQVVRDRMAWGLTAEEVVTAPNQFASPYVGDLEQAVADEIKEAVVRVFDGGERIFAEPTTHFYATYISAPYWTEEKVCRGTIGIHRFYGGETNGN